MTAVVLAVLLAGCLGLALRPPRWLVPDRLARWFGVTMAITLVGGSCWKRGWSSPASSRAATG